MNNQKVLNILQHALSITVQMQKKAEGALWNDIIQLERQREPLLDAVFPLEAEADDNKIREILEEIIDINQVLGRQCMKEKDTLQKQLKKINLNKKAVSAYSR